MGVSLNDKRTPKFCRKSLLPLISSNKIYITFAELDTN